MLDKIIGWTGLIGFACLILFGRWIDRKDYESVLRYRGPDSEDDDS